MVSIEGLSRGAVLAALYNASKPQGMGFMQFRPEPMTETEADDLLKTRDSFDYLHGRVMKINLRQGDTKLNEYLYDRDNGPGAAMRVIESLLAKK